MGILAAPIAFAALLGVSLLIGLAAQRLLGLRLGPVRMVLAGFFALIVGPLIFFALLRDHVPEMGPGADPSTVATPDAAAVWFGLLAAVLTMLASMIFLVVMEAFVPLGSVPPARVWGRGLRGRFRRARRYWQIVWLSLRHGLGPYVRGTRNRNLEVPSGRSQFGRALANTLNAGGVTFVKLGQLLSTRRDVLSPEIVAELERLQDDAAPVPWPAVERVLVEELGGPVEGVFASFDQEPLAAASVGQVHAARLRSGASVVVKVQRPGIHPVVERDLDIAVRLAVRLESATRWGRSMGVRTLAHGLAASIREELDYRLEAENIRSVARELPADAPVRVPMPHAAVSTERVLVMDRLDGLPVARADEIVDRLGLDRAHLARQLLDVLVRQITAGGVFHADPHAGNIMVLDDGRLGLLDFGSVGRLDATLQNALERLLLAVDRGDALGASDALLELVPRPDEIDQPSLERDLGRFLARYGSGIGVSGARMFADLFGIVTDHGLSIPPEVAAVFRTFATAEGTLSALAPGFDLVAETKALATRQFAERLSPDALRATAVDELTALMPVLRRLPRRLDHIAGAAEHGRLAMSVRLLADERDRAVITDWLHAVLLTVLATTSGIMGVLLVGTTGGPTVTDAVSLYALLGYNLLAISAILALRVLVQVFRRT